MNDRILSMLGLCRKSGNLVMGFDICLDYAKKNKSYMILITKDISENTKKKLYNQINNNKIIHCIDYSMDEISKCTGKFSGIISINNKDFAKKIEQLIKSKNQEDNLWSNVECTK